MRLSYLFFVFIFVKLHLINCKKDMKAIFISALLFSLSIHSLAQSSTAVRDTVQSPLPSLTVSNITVTSTRHTSRIDDLALPVGIADSMLIMKLPAQTPADALRFIPGISLMRDGVWSTSLSIRGMSRSGIVMLVDGNRIETATDIAAGLSMIDMNDISRIEVIKGAASSLYGTGAMGGVINVITSSPQYSSGFRLSGSVSGGYSSVNQLRSGALSLNASADWWTAKVSSSLRKAGDAETPRGTLNNSQFSDNSISAALSIKPYANTDISAGYQRYYADDVGIPGGYPLFPDNAVVRYPEEKRELFSISFTQSNISETIRNISAKYYHQYILRDVENLPGTVQKIPAQNGKPAQQIEVLKITPAADHFTNGFELQSDFIAGSSHYIIAGAEAWQRNYEGVRSKYQLISTFEADGKTLKSQLQKIIIEKPLPKSWYRSIGVFLQDEIRLLPNRFSVSIGGRVDKISVHNESVLNPVIEITDGTVNYSPAGQKQIWSENNSDDLSWSFNLGLLLRASERLSFSLNAARSFRSPSLEERYQYIEQGRLIKAGNPDLEPERGYFLDAGIKFSGDMLRFSINGFVNFMSELVAEIPGKFEGRDALVKTNIGKSTLYGYDLEAEGRIYRKLSIYSTAAYVRGEDTDNRTNLPQIAPFNGSIGVRGDILDYLQWDLSAVFFSAQNNVAAGEITTPGYTLCNIYLTSNPFDLGMLSMTVSAGVENVFDKAYRNHLSTNRGSITIEPGRSIFLKTNIKF